MIQSESEDESLLSGGLGIEQVPPDRYNLTWFLFLLLGVGVLFPWNAFIQANDYFKGKYPNFPIEFALPLIYNYPNMIFLLVISKWGDKLPLRGRLLLGFFIEVFVFIIIPTQDAIPNVFTKNVSLGIILSMAAVCGLCAALLIGTLFGFAAMFPPHYMTAVMSGNGVAGIVIFGMKAAMKAGFGDSGSGPQRTTIAYFATAGGVILACFVAILFMPRLAFVRYHLNKNAFGSKSGQVDSINDGTLLTDPTRSKYTPTFMRVFSQYWDQALNVGWVFFVTLSLFPGMLVNIQPDPEALKNWLVVLLIGTFQVGDFVGRTIPRFVTRVTPEGEVVVLISRRWNWILSALHTIFFPLIIILVVPLAPRHAILQHNAFAFVVVALFSILNGFAGTIPMIYGPSSVDPSQAGRVGTTMAVFLNLGIFLGAHMSFLMLWSIDPSKLKAAIGLH